MSDAIRATLEQYVERFNAGNFDKIVELFTEDARQEDPVGQPPNVGHDAIRQFFANVAAVGRPQIVVLHDPVIIGNEAVFVFKAVTDLGDQTVTVPLIVDVIEFDDEGRITSLRAFFAPDSLVVE